MEKMEVLLCQTLEKRPELQYAYDHLPEDHPGSDELWEEVVENRGEIRGMLKMLAIMRSTSSKIELQRARNRIKHKGV